MDIVKICEVVDGCEDCPKYGDDCDGDKMTEHTDYIRRADAIDAVAQEWLSEASAESPYVNDDDIGEYRKLAEELFEDIPSADAVHGWIPCSDRVPKAEDMYQPPEQRYLCQLEAHGVRKFCVLSRLKGAVSPFWDWYGIAVYDSDVTAWMPLPKPYKGGDDKGGDDE